MKRLVTLLVLAWTMGLAAQSREWVASPSGSGTACTASAPCALAPLLIASSPVRPGDTIWLSGGTYPPQTIELTGTAEAPILIRARPGERVTVDVNGSDQSAIRLAGAYYWVWGLELMNSSTARTTLMGGSEPLGFSRASSGGVSAVRDTTPHHIKIINCIIHDNGIGVALFSVPADMEVYGNLVYRTGWVAPDRAHGHNLYMQNQNGVRRIADNLIFQAYDIGAQIYGSSAAYLNNFQIDGNVFWQNGHAGGITDTRQLLFGGGRQGTNNSVTNNLTYYTRPGSDPSGGPMNFGYGAGHLNSTVTGNYFAGGYTVFENPVNVTATGNTFWFRNLQASYPNNTYYDGTAKPAANAIFVRPNLYEPGRGHVVVYNWTNQASVSVSLDGLGLTAGQRYAVRLPEQYYGAPVLTGVYTAGQSITLPMQGLATDQPIGGAWRWTGTAFEPFPLSHTAPTFAVFVVVPENAGASPPPPPPTPNPVSLEALVTALEAQLELAREQVATLLEQIKAQPDAQQIAQLQQQIVALQLQVQGMAGQKVKDDARIVQLQSMIQAAVAALAGVQ